MLPIAQCLKLPGIADGKLFRRNVRQSLGISNKVNKAMRDTLVHPEKAKYFFFFHNGITALCRNSRFPMTSAVFVPAPCPWSTAANPYPPSTQQGERSLRKAERKARFCFASTKYLNMT